MNIRNRLTQLEKQTPKDPPRIFVYYEGDDFGTCNREPMTRAEWDKIKTDRDTEIAVVYTSEYFKDLSR